jgi:hypothetical protein
MLYLSLRIYHFAILANPFDIGLLKHVLGRRCGVKATLNDLCLPGLAFDSLRANRGLQMRAYRIVINTQNSSRAPTENI